ncbi:multidrug effflux MFS transporter [Sphingopyxis sp.]|uniref:multidrug effflux MFS transporter n=1 Tax=Sphingopyxis sp. TaxID=1908224 RepID=UPI002D785A67|nr:multidrug effflux MFS transporter [Sphingopyxis sp.]HET6522885.1 multidrug effflux MFS transporter [Sphingopyxis sp.]
MSAHEFIGMMAAIMSIYALGVDMMLPALPEMAASLKITEQNDQQWIITAFLIGFGIGQLFMGPLADRFGRRPVMLGSLLFFAVICGASTLAYDLPTIVITRMLQGFATAAARVVTISIIRDRFSGSQMARVISLIFIVYLAVPVLAPPLGQLVIAVAPWQSIFVALSVYALLIFAWGAVRLRETLNPKDVRHISVSELTSAARFILRDRHFVAYTLAATLLIGSMIGFISSAQQIFSDVFHAGHYFTIALAGISLFMAAAAFLNSRIVVRLGARRVSHTALIVMVVACGVHLALVMGGVETLPTFLILQSFIMFFYALASGNFNALCMEPVGHIAGAASSIQGFLQTVGGAAIGIIIGQSYNHSTLPIAAGYLCLSLLALGVVLIAERGKLFG